jgi:tetratricopeptide (TPR) repeat protein
MEDAPLQTALERLAEADILLVQGLPPESDYRFKHALIQDAAYENLLKSRRQLLHRRVAEILRDRFADTAASEPEALAYHFTQAGLTDAAIEWWGKAGDQALRRSAFQEAISHLGKAIEMADKVGDAAPRVAAAAASAGQRLKLQTSYGQALAWAKGFAAEETRAAFGRALELPAGTDAAARFPAYYGKWLTCCARGEMGSARQTAEMFLREAKIEGRMVEAAVASRNLGLTWFWQGDFTEAKTNLEEALRLCEAQHDPEVNVSFGQDTAAAAKAFLALTTWVLGKVTRARELIEQAIERAVETAHAPTLANTHLFKVTLEMLCDDADGALRDTTRLIELTREHGLTLYLAFGMAYFSWARARRGDSGDNAIGVAELREAIAAITAQGIKYWVPNIQGRLAELEAEGESPEAALAGSTKRWRSRSKPESIVPTLSCTASAARFY